jgi:hypothetical protein
MGFQHAAAQAERTLKRRYFYNCGEEAEADICEAFRSGFCIDHSALDDNALPAVLVLATWLRNYQGTEIVEDYDGFVEFQKTMFPQCQSPVLYLASCICILYDRNEHPGEEAFIMEKIPQIYEEMMTEETVHVEAPQAKPRRRKRK